MVDNINETKHFRSESLYFRSKVENGNGIFRISNANIKLFVILPDWDP